LQDDQVRIPLFGSDFQPALDVFLHGRGNSPFCV
jgi:hypothetical protein